MNFAYFLSISLGALVFLPLQFITRASWSVVIRRPCPRPWPSPLPFMALLTLPVLLNLGQIYDWAAEHPLHLTPDLAMHKAPFLNEAFFLWAAGWPTSPSGAGWPCSSGGPAAPRT